MVNLDCLKEIGFEATSRVWRVETNKNIISLTDDMIDVIDNVREKADTMKYLYPAFYSRYSIFFSYDNRLYRIVTLNNEVSIQTTPFIGKDDDYSFSEFLKDYDAYYYLDLNTLRVKSIYNNKEYIVTEAN